MPLTEQITGLTATPLTSWEAHGVTYHTAEIEAVFSDLGTGPRGLSSAEAARRLVEAGPNELLEVRRRGPALLLLGQFKDFMVLVLLVSAAVAGAVGKPTDSLAIVAIVVLNALVGVLQELRAQRAIAALRAMAGLTATVLRDGVPTAVTAAELVVGDVVLLEAGRVVPADLRLAEAVQLQVQEAALLQAAEDPKTPLQRRLSAFGQRLAVAILGICAVVFVAGVLRGEPLAVMFLTAVSLAVAAIPEALTAVITIALALGARRMARERALVRRLPAVETLGSVTYICSDKTGTLTLNRMTVEEVVLDRHGGRSGWQASAGGGRRALLPWSRPVQRRVPRWFGGGAGRPDRGGAARLRGGGGVRQGRPRWGIPAPGGAALRLGSKVHDHVPRPG